MESTRMINTISLGLVLLELGVELKDWSKKALKDGDLDAEEAGRLSDPIEKALNRVVKLPPGKTIAVNIHVVEDA